MYEIEPRLETGICKTADVYTLSFCQQADLQSGSWRKFNFYKYWNFRLTVKKHYIKNEAAMVWVWVGWLF